jgi:hypothetical protein
MHHTSFDHLPVEVLERFALNTCSEEEVEMIETHILACESCVGALENLDLDIAATKLALADFATQGKTAEERQPKRRNWFSVPNLSWAGAALAACAFCLLAFVPVNVKLTAERGDEHVSVVPEWRKFNLNVDGETLPAGKLAAEVVNEKGASVWAGYANNLQGRVHIDGLRITHTGHFLARVYNSGSDHELMAEYPFDVKFELFQQ